MIFLKNLKLRFFIISLSLLLMSSQTLAKAPEHITRYIPESKLSGQGLFTWFGFELYLAKLWLPSNINSQKNLYQNAFALDLQYKKNFLGHKIAQTSDEEIERLGIATPEQRSAWLSQMKKIFPNVENGAHITGIYLPNQGARFYKNGQFIGEIEDPAFAKAFFAIWLDQNTRAKKLRSQLLSGIGNTHSTHVNSD